MFSKGGGMFKKIMVPTDGTPLSEKVIDAAIEFAKINLGSKIFGISVVVPISFSPFEGLGGVDVKDHEQSMFNQASAHVNKLKAAVEAAGVPCETYVAKASSPAAEIVKASIEHECDCIFMSSHGRKGLNKLFLGSETQKVLAQATMPVIVYR